MPALRTTSIKTRIETQIAIFFRAEAGHFENHFHQNKD
ncbi:Uncharacterized protein dnm_098310 [Desulfonema magnum]|uniref:Uncharacterized protein n=1 Tax=Desulfonema magnum TaxID=45655 RepID=A0A975BYX1_9BACT|nr:Uncharacterized protein dnm_098310 [Desulfonema magnum]